MPRRAPLLAATALIVLSCVTGSNRADDETPLGRLPRDVVPLHYSLDLAIDPAVESFEGVVEIQLRIDRPTESFFMHAEDLQIEAAQIVLQGGRTLPAQFEPAGPAGLVRVSVGQTVGPGVALLRVGYEARFGESLRGLYRVSVGDDAYAFTQFEPIAARLAFPGFDEPSFKTPYDVTLTVPSDLSAIANAPAISRSEPDAGLAQIRFATTPPLPTYLVAIAVGPFDRTVGPAFPSGPDAWPIPLRGISVRGRGDEIAWALENTPRLVGVLEDYFGRAYPYRKLDVIAVPEMSFSAMENVGAITFRDTVALVDPKTAPETQIRRFHSIMAHELAHQWFGNLVTMNWWDDIWLNEAFASWMATRVIESTHPDERADLHRVETVQWAMKTDSRVSARRIRQPIETNDDIRNAFDAITYEKGAGVLAMFERWLGAETFRDGVRRYLDAHAEGNADTQDLLAALSDASGRDVTGPFSTFLDQPGVPFLETESVCSEDGAHLRVHQSRYLPTGSAGNRDLVWQIPVCVRYGAGGEVRESCGLLTERTDSIALAACPDWVLPNADAAGYYRFSQSAADAEKLRTSGWSALSAVERLAVANALEAAFHAGATPAADVYAALEPIAKDPNRAVAVSAMPLIRLAAERFVYTELRPAVSRFGSKLYAPAFARLGFEGRKDDDGEARLLRKSLFAFLAFGVLDETVRAEATRRGRVVASSLAKGRYEARNVDPELVTGVLSVAVQTGLESVFDGLEDALAATDDSLWRDRILRALAAARRPTLAHRARELALDDRVRNDETLTTLWVQMAQPATRDDTWEWIRENWSGLVAKVGTQRASWMPWLAGSFCSEKKAAELDEFLVPRAAEIEGGARNAAGTIESVRLCHALVEAQAQSAREFFAEID